MKDKLLSFLRSLISSDNDVSSKRVVGIFILITITIYAISVSKIDSSVLDLLNSLSYIGCVLLGIGIIDKLKTLK